MCESLRVWGDYQSETGIPIIVEDKCVSCNACVKACPQKLIEIHPVSQKYHVYCKSKDKGPIAKNHAIEHASDVAFALKRQKKAE